jgi:hypothetical protein
MSTKEERKEKNAETVGEFVAISAPAKASAAPATLPSLLSIGMQSMGEGQSLGKEKGRFEKKSAGHESGST